MSSECLTRSNLEWLFWEANARSDSGVSFRRQTSGGPLCLLTSWGTKKSRKKTRLWLWYIWEKSIPGATIYQNVNRKTFSCSVSRSFKPSRRACEKSVWKKRIVCMGLPEIIIQNLTPNSIHIGLSEKKSCRCLHENRFSSKWWHKNRYE